MQKGEGNKAQAGASSADQTVTSPQQPAQTTNTSISSATGSVAEPAVEYKSSDIGVKTTVKKDPFAKHKTDQAERKRARRKLYPLIAIAVVGVLALIALVIFIIWLINSTKEGPSNITKDDSVTSEEIISFNNAANELGDAASAAYSDKADDPYAKDGNLDAANEVFDGAIAAADETATRENNAESTYYANQLKMQKMGFYMNRGLYQEAVDMGLSLDTDNMVAEQRASFYMLLTNCYSNLGDEAKTIEYEDKSNALTQEIGGYGSGQ